MKILKKEMSRKEFLKYISGGAILLGLGSFGINLKTKKKTNNSNTGYGSGGYGR